jgi:hypothetical protein
MKNLVSALTLIIFIVFANPIKAQFSIDAEIRPRVEANHGFRTLPVESSQTAYFVSQRTRLNLRYITDKFTTYISLQDVRLWGQEDWAHKTGLNSSSVGFNVSQAWFDWKFAENWGLKMGRQIWNYDDKRILANRNWSQIGLSWDALLVHLDKDNFHFHFGSSFNNTNVSFNENDFVSEDNPYEEPLGFRIKYFNFVWMKFIISEKFSFSLAEYLASYLAANTSSTLYTLSTAGLHINYHTKNIKILANAFYQYGNKTSNKNGNAYMLTFSGNYKLNKIDVGLNVDYQSGKGDGNTQAFDLMYGARFKYYGWMNYYVLPGDTKDGGLVDLSPNIRWTIHEKHSLYAIYNFFWLATDVYSDLDGGDYSYLTKNLGAEIDLNYSYTYDKSFNIQFFFGYYFATETTEFVKNIERGKSTSPYWASIMLTFKPKFFSTAVK